ncbi:hypothetical protein EDB84DRAFT_52141 [Lactarius hengduanensis]|nr:hypothetical protein EDB84DRAFT_52141 [Lactarius hengduanensis]
MDLDAVRSRHPRATPAPRVHTRTSTVRAQLFGVSYSEHSPFFELTCFVLSLDWAHIVPTVNVESAASRAKISTWIARWEAERRKRPPGVVSPYRTPEYWNGNWFAGLSGCLARRVLGACL